MTPLVQGGPTVTHEIKCDEPTGLARRSHGSPPVLRSRPEFTEPYTMPRPGTLCRGESGAGSDNGDSVNDLGGRARERVPKAPSSVLSSAAAGGGVLHAAMSAW